MRDSQALNGRNPISELDDAVLQHSGFLLARRIMQDPPFRSLFCSASAPRFLAAFFTKQWDVAVRRDPGIARDILSDVLYRFMRSSDRSRICGLTLEHLVERAGRSKDPLCRLLLEQYQSGPEEPGSGHDRTAGFIDSLVQLHAGRESLFSRAIDRYFAWTGRQGDSYVPIVKILVAYQNLSSEGLLGGGCLAFRMRPESADRPFPSVDDASPDLDESARLAERMAYEYCSRPRLRADWVVLEPIDELTRILAPTVRGSSGAMAMLAAHACRLDERPSPWWVGITCGIEPETGSMKSVNEMSKKAQAAADAGMRLLLHHSPHDIAAPFDEAAGLSLMLSPIRSTDMREAFVEVMKRIDRELEHLRDGRLKLDYSALDSPAAVRAAMLQVLRDAAEEVDHPSQWDYAERKAAWAMDVLKRRQLDTDEAQYLMFRIRLSRANHTGDRALAGRLWEEFLAFEGAMLEKDEPQSLLWLEKMRRRRSVSLIDTFCFTEAEDVLAGWKERLEDLAARSSAYSSRTGLEVRRVLGCHHGQLGQIRAFRGGRENRLQAEKHFKDALELFSKTYEVRESASCPEDLDVAREWCYLGHLACDMGADGAGLWQETCDSLPVLALPNPVIDRHSYYYLALQIKGAGIFNPFSVPDLLAQLRDAWPKKFHPADRETIQMGMVLLTAGVAAQNAFSKASDPVMLKEADAWYEEAREYFQRLPVREPAGDLSSLHLLFERAADLRRQNLFMAFPDAFPGRASREAAEKSLDGFLALLSGDLKAESQGLADLRGADLPGCLQKALGFLRFNFW